MDIKVTEKTAQSLIKRLPNGHRSQKCIDKKASSMSHHMMKLISKTPKEELTPEKYLEILYKVTYPQKPPVLINHQEKGEADALFRTKFKVETTNKYLYIKEGIAFELLFNLKNGLINTPKNIIIHESRHLFDEMCNHKHRVNRNLNTLVKREYLNKFFSWSGIRNELCDITPPDKRAYEVILESYSDAEKIGILRDVRYKIKSEINAYSDEDTMELLCLPFLFRFFEKLLVNVYSRKYVYKDRLKVVEGLLRKYIKKERAALSCKSFGGANVV